jgi:hypothetical protein
MHSTFHGRAGRRAAWFAVALLGLTTAAASLSSSDPQSAARAVEEVRREERDVERRTVAVMRARVSSPLELSFGTGVHLAKQPRGFPCYSGCDYRGPIVRAELGLGGAQVGAGYARLIGQQGIRRQVLSRVWMGWGLTGSIMRTWAGPWLGRPVQTLIGIEGDFSIAQVNFSLGAMRSLGNDEDHGGWEIVGGLGWGF